MADLIVGIILLIIVGAAIRYIVKQKKKGVKCIGCPSASVCAAKMNGNGTCGCKSDKKI